MTNLAQDWVLRSGKTLKGAQEEYDGACIDFAGDFLDAIGRGRMVYFDKLIHPAWKYHAAVEIDGTIHDLWYEKPLPTGLFAIMIGATEVSYPLEEEEKITA